jgi:hypothetical protein
MQIEKKQELYFGKMNYAFQILNGVDLRKISHFDRIQKYIKKEIDTAYQKKLVGKDAVYNELISLTCSLELCDYSHII